jgi:hypothetical protein
MARKKKRRHRGDAVIDWMAMILTSELAAHAIDVASRWPHHGL